MSDYVVVPREPTLEMVVAGAIRKVQYGTALDIYRAMLAAASAAPQARDAAERALAELIDKLCPGLDTGDTLADAAKASAAIDRLRREHKTMEDRLVAEMTHANSLRDQLATTAAPQLEPMTRFCPGCGSVGPVPETYRDCCPDGIQAREIPQSLAYRCRDLFKLALSAAPAAPQPEQRSAWVGSIPAEESDQEFADQIAAMDAKPQPEQQAEPVAWYLPADGGDDSMFRDHATVQACTGNKWEGWRPLYTTPQPTPEQVREACARVCDSIYWKYVGVQYGEHRYVIAECAAAIRAMDLSKIGGGK